MIPTHLLNVRRSSLAAFVVVTLGLVLLCDGYTLPGRAQRPAQPPPPAAAKPAPRPPDPAAIEKAAKIRDDARKALGVDRVPLTTVIATGRTRRVRGNNLVPIEFEIAIELPDKYVRRDESPAEDSDPTSSGFNGADLIQIPAVVGPPRGAPMPPGFKPPGPEQLDAQRRTRVLNVKQEFARLALGLFGDSPAVPLTFSYAAVAEAPQGKAHVLDVQGEGNFTARFFVNTDTHLPVMVSWQLPPTNVVVTVPGAKGPETVAPGAVVVEGPAPPSAGAGKEETDAYAKAVTAVRAKAQATPVEHRLYFADYREADGVRFPFRIRRAIGPETTEETTFDRYRVNTRIDPRKFQPVK